MSPLAELFVTLTHVRYDGVQTEAAARAWARNIEAWATHQIRYYCWDYLTAERTVARVRDLAKRS